MANDPDSAEGAAGEQGMGSQNEVYADLGTPEAGAEREHLSVRLQAEAERKGLLPLDPALGLETTNPSDPRTRPIDFGSADARLNPGSVDNDDLDRYRNMALDDLEVPEEFAGMGYREMLSRQRELESQPDHREEAGRLRALTQQVEEAAQGPYEDFVVDRVGTATVVHGATFDDGKGTGNTWVGDKVTVYGRDVLVGRYRDSSKVVTALKAANYSVES